MLGNLLQSFTTRRPKLWDAILPWAEFAYNSAPSRSTQKSPFEIIYGRAPLHYLDLFTPTPSEERSKTVEDMATSLIKIHREVHQKLEAITSSYKQAVDARRQPRAFEEGQLVWVYLRKEKFPSRRYNKLNERRIGPYKILRKINENAYRVDLPLGIHTHPTFNIQDLSTYHSENSGNFEMSFHSAGEDDVASEDVEAENPMQVLIMVHVGTCTTRPPNLQSMRSMSLLISRNT